MTGHHPNETRERLQELWGRWTRIVGLFADRRPARRRVDPRAYAALRHDLLAACHALAEAQADGEKRAYYNALAEMVRPWLSTRVLARTDREILTVLLLRCREVKRGLGGRRWRPEWPTRLGLGLVTIVAGVLGLGLAWNLRVFRVGVIDTVRDAADTAWLTVKYSSRSLKLAVAAVLLVAASIYTIWRSVRSSS